MFHAILVASHLLLFITHNIQVRLRCRNKALTNDELGFKKDLAFSGFDSAAFLYYDYDTIVI
jgi:hypothetical protein